MTGDSSNIGCLEALAVPSTNNSAQSAPKALIPAGLYTRGCILWCIQRRNTLQCILCILSSSSRGMFYRVGDKPWLITEAHVTLLALHLSQTEKAPFLSICYLYFFFSGIIFKSINRCCWDSKEVTLGMKMLVDYLNIYNNGFWLATLPQVILRRTSQEAKKIWLETLTLGWHGYYLG